MSLPIPIPPLPGAKRTVSVWRDFKRFAFKGNAIDLAIGVILGGAFGRVVDGLVHFLIMPLIGLITPQEGNWDTLQLTIAGSTIEYGRFLGVVINFLIIAGVLFLFTVKLSKWLFAEAEREKDDPSPPVNKQEQLLAEIRDLLQAQHGATTGGVAPDITRPDSNKTDET